MKWYLWVIWSRGRYPCPWQGCWNEIMFKIPSNTNHSVVLWFCEIMEANLFQIWLSKDIFLYHSLDFYRYRYFIFAVFYFWVWAPLSRGDNPTKTLWEVILLQQSILCCCDCQSKPLLPRMAAAGTGKCGARGVLTPQGERSWGREKNRRFSIILFYFINNRKICTQNTLYNIMHVFDIFAVPGWWGAFWGGRAIARKGCSTSGTSHLCRKEGKLCPA